MAETREAGMPEQLAVAKADVVGQPMLVWNSKTKGWHVLGEDGRRFELVPDDNSVRFGGAGLKGIRGSRADIDLVQHWQNEAIRAQCLRDRLEDKVASIRVEIAAKQAAYNDIKALEAENAVLREAVKRSHQATGSLERWLVEKDPDLVLPLALSLMLIDSRQKREAALSQEAPHV